LLSRPSTKEALYFSREGTAFTIKSERFKEGQGLERRTRENALFLSVCAQFNGEVSQSLLSWFDHWQIVQGASEPWGFSPGTIKQLKEPQQKTKILNMIKVADPGIIDFALIEENLTVDDIPKELPEDLKNELVKSIMKVELKTLHRKVDAENKERGFVPFDLERNESAGTQKLVKLVGPLLDTLEHGKILVIDELDARLHPLLTRLIVSLFNSSINTANAQLIFASHDTTLLHSKFFRRDQVWFVEKDPYGATDLYSLFELKGVRKEAVFSKEYIQGKYGAIPFIGDPRWLLGEDQHE
jgi:hypothetical protein